MSVKAILAGAGLLAAAGSLVVLPSASATTAQADCAVPTSKPAATQAPSPASSVKPTEPSATTRPEPRATTAPAERSCATARPATPTRTPAQVRVRPKGAPETGDGSLAG
ncbi:hypothetical protein FHX82_004790 [Amycolatopsis bartoniae]|uniref:Uncharacterized protein n=1 Tax=Amycolatopsis bartoniae TaxID=941986 RepID=A0A8H9ISB3_9PSEU|nr:hypothetical protein [Amycolatopsis bartoniae]MBB2937714.1 hypothetical protein [Amycolatopsis bartoniae]TVT08202.1 hypothetical protein FNH07_13455 [Amycolatopsis bartoniae]GHF40135.1 hypothetical protein GCM10017566_11890 [Amycolatopsis bartoniae]